MEFQCPTCFKKINNSYNHAKKITSVDHGKPTNCNGIGQSANIVSTESKSQQKTKETTIAVAAAALHRQNKSASNFNKYQTPLKNSAQQQTRIDTAKKVGLKGHASSNSNSGKNGATTKGLNVINSATKKK